MSALRYSPTYPRYLLRYYPATLIVFLAVVVFFVVTMQFIQLGFLGVVGMVLLYISYRQYRYLYPDVLKAELEELRRQKLRDHIMDDSVKYMYPDVIKLDLEKKS